jgi:hypothetical protein
MSRKKLQKSVYRRNKAPPQRRGLPKGDINTGEIAMGKFADLLTKCEEQKKLADKAAKMLYNNLVDEVSGIFMDPDNYESLEHKDNRWYFVLKDQDDVNRYISLMKKSNYSAIIFKSGKMYKKESINRMFVIESTEEDIDLIFEQIESAFEKLKRD